MSVEKDQDNKVNFDFDFVLMDMVYISDFAFMVFSLTLILSVLMKTTMSINTTTTQGSIS